MTDHTNHEPSALDRRVHEALAVEYARERRHRANRRWIYSGAIAVGLIVIAGVLGFTAIVGQDPTPPTLVDDAAALQAVLAERGFDITPQTPGDRSISPLGGVETSFCAMDSLVFVYQYPTIEDRTSASETINPDGALSGTAPSTWPHAPTFFVHDRLIVAAIGSDIALHEALTDILGPAVSLAPGGTATPSPCGT